MSNSSSWSIVRRTLASIVHSRLKVLPRSTLDSQACAQHKIANASMLVKLGKLQTPEELTKCKKTAMTESSEELLEFFASIWSAAVVFYVHSFASFCG